MVKQKDAQLDLVFAALADTTRRRVLEQLDQIAQREAGGASISELAQPHGMSLPGFMKHLAVLEAAGLIARAKEGRVVRCELDAAALQDAAAWMSRYERFWTEQLDALGRYLYHQEEVAPCRMPNDKPRSASSGTIPSPPKESGEHGPSRKR